MTISRSQPVSDGLRPTTSGSEPSAADEFVAMVSERADAFAKQAADGLYERLLEATQDYLIDNARFNIGEKIAAAQRQARHDREAWAKAEGRARALTDALRDLWLATASGTDRQRLSAITAAGDLLARIGAFNTPTGTSDVSDEVPGKPS